MAGLVTNRTPVPTRTKVAGAGVGLVVIVLIVLAAAGVFSGGSNNVGTVSTGATPSTSTGASSSPTAAMFPFGKPSSKPDYSVPSPPGEPTMVPTIATKTTTRLYGSDPFQEAVSITQHVWPAAVSTTAPT
jgi:hypothetical protein